MKRTVYLLTCLVALALSACGGGGSLKPSATGAANEILVVIDDDIYKSAAGDTLMNILDRNIPNMPQFEPYFNISRTNHAGFTGLLRPARNVILVNVGDIYSSVKLKHQEDAWSSPQSVMYINGPDVEKVAEAMHNYSDDILDYFVRAERKRAQNFQKKSQEAETVNKIKEKFGFTMTVPKGFNRSKESDESIWIANASRDISQNLVIYSFPYTDTLQFSREYLLQKRDSVLKALVPGPSEGSYITTEYRYDPPRYKHSVTSTGKFATEIRGLWRVEGDIMGGPFTSVSTLDEKNQRIVTAECFLYAPNQYKRNALRLLESVLYTISFD